jgi:hypothetical protein
LGEDLRNDSGTRVIFDDFRIYEIIEVLLFCSALYQSLGFSKDTLINVSIRYDGLSDRIISCNEPLRRTIFRLGHEKRALQDTFITEHSMKLGEIQADLLNLVKYFANRLFILFDLHELIDNDFRYCIDAFLTNFARIPGFSPSVVSKR